MSSAGVGMVSFIRLVSAPYLLQTSLTIDKSWLDTLNHGHMRTVLAIQLVLIFFAPVALVADDDAKNIAGYGKTIWGMTEDEVLKAEAPSAKRLKNPEITQIGDLGSVVINQVRIAETNFTVNFIFDRKNHRLVRVDLESPHNLAPGGRTFSEIKKLLTEKYGSPTFDEWKRVFWKLPKTKIEIRNASYPELSWRQVLMYYTPADASS